MGRSRSEQKPVRARLTQRKAQGPYRTCNESKEEEKEAAKPVRALLVQLVARPIAVLRLRSFDDAERIAWPRAVEVEHVPPSVDHQLAERFLRKVIQKPGDSLVVDTRVEDRGDKTRRVRQVCEQEVHTHLLKLEGGVLMRVADGSDDVLRLGFRV